MKNKERDEKQHKFQSVINLELAEKSATSRATKLATE